MQMKKVYLLVLTLAFVIALVNVSPQIVRHTTTNLLSHDTAKYSLSNDRLYAQPAATTPTAPVAYDDIYSVDEDTQLIISDPGVLYNDLDENGDPLTAVVDLTPSYGSLSLSQDGSFIYTPDENYFGEDSFTYHADDGTYSSDAAVVTITINPIDDAPVAQSDEFTIYADTVLSFSAADLLSNDYDPDGDLLSFVLFTYPSYGILTELPNQEFTYTPPPGWSGVDSFGYYAYGGAQYSSEATVTISVIKDVTPPTTAISLSGTLGDNGWYLSDVTVTLTATDDTSSLITTWYSLDSSTWMEYTGPFMVSAQGITTVSFYSVDEFGNAETTVAQDVQIDSTPPVTTFLLEMFPGDLGPRNGWYLSPLLITLTATDAVSSVAQTYYSLDGTVWSEYTGPFVLFQDGVIPVSFYSIDAAGNIEPTQTSNVQIDSTPPEIEIVLDTDLLISISDLESGISHYTYSVSGYGWIITDSVDGQGQHNIVLRIIVPFDGTINVYVEATNEAIESTSLSSSFWFDITPPETTITLDTPPGDLGPRNGWYVSDVIVTLTAVDRLSAVASTKYSYDGDTWMEYTGPFTVTTEGSTTIFYYSIDAVGNVESTKQTTLQIDKTPPVIEYSFDGKPGQYGWYISYGVLTITLTDEVAGIEWLSYDITSGLWSLSGIVYPADEHRVVLTFDIDVEGLITVNVDVHDYAFFNPSETWFLPIDMTPPQTYLSTDRVYGGVVVTLIPHDALSGIAGTFFSLDQLTWSIYSGPFTLTSGNVVSVYYYSIDMAGLAENVQTSEVVVDDVPPETSIALTGTLDSRGWFIYDVIVTLTATDEFSVASTMYSLDNINWYVYTSPFTITEDGLTTVYYYSIDAAGNIEQTKSDSFIVDTDTTGPIITIVYTGASTDGNPGYWTVTAVDPESGIDWITVEIDGVLVGSTQGDYAVPNSLGAHTIRVNATNADLKSGIEDQEFSTLSETVMIIDDDVTGPEITITHSGGTTSADPGMWTITVSDPESGISSVNVEIDGEVVGTTAGDYAVPAAEGTHNITVTAYNADLDRGEIDQEMSTASASVTITGSTTPGTITGAGWIKDANGNKAHFAFVVKLKSNGDLRGAFLYSFRDGNWLYIVSSEEILTLVIDGNHAYFEAKCDIVKINLHRCKSVHVAGHFTVRVDIWDNPGKHAKDIFQIRIFDASGEVWYEAGYDPLGYVHGAIVIHEYKHLKNCHSRHGRW